MRASLSTIKILQQSNVLEIKFVRKIPKPGAASTRRMICTGSLTLLNSPEGRIALNFRPAYNRPRYNPDMKNIAITWDIFMQDYRNINMNACEVLAVIPVKDFWKFFNEKRLGQMSPGDKIRFMNT